MLTLFLVCSIVVVLECKKLSIPMGRNFEWDEWDEPRTYTKEQLRPQEFDDNPFQYSGFYDVDEKYGGHMFYTFFPSRDGNKNAPLVIWLQGGPGCSSMMGLFAEMGPFKIDKETLKLSENPFSWNEHYQLLFIDQPVGSGWSYFEKDEGYATTEVEVGEMLYKFLVQFYEDDRYKTYKKNDLFIFGESYAGKYIPAIAKKIMNEKFEVNMKGIGIGDGLTHPEEQFEKYDQFALANSIIGFHDLGKVVDLQNKTIRYIKEGKYVDAYNTWNVLGDFVDKSSGGVNEYDIRTHVGYDFSYITKYMNLNTTKQLLHVPLEMKFSQCSSKVYTALVPDICQSIRQNIIDLLEQSDTKILIYNAQFDMLISVPGSINGWVYDMPWKYQKEFRDAQRDVWKLEDGSFAGWKKRYGNLHTIVVGDSGHLSPMNQPKRALEMLTKFVEGKM